MSEESKTTSGGGRSVLIGIAAAVIAALLGYNVGFSGGEKGLKAAQDQAKQAEGQAKTALDQLTALQVTSSEQAKKVESQTAELEKQTASVADLTAKLEGQAKQLKIAKADLTTRSGEVEKQTAQIAEQTAQIEKQTAEIEQLRAEAKQLARDAKANSSELLRLREQVKTLSAQSDDYLATIMGAIDKKSFNLVVGGVQQSLVRNRVSVGLSYVSLEDRTARITLGGETMNVVLQEAQKIKLSDKSCDLTMTNIVSDTEAAFQVDCGGA